MLNKNGSDLLQGKTVLVDNNLKKNKHLEFIHEKMHPSYKSMLFKLDEDKKKKILKQHTIFIAHPQIGKTGAFLSLIKQLMDKYNWINRETFYQPRNLGDYHKIFKPINGKELVHKWSEEVFKKYHKLNDKSFPDIFKKIFVNLVNNYSFDTKIQSFLDIGCGHSLKFLQFIIDNKEIFSSFQSYCGIDAGPSFIKIESV